MSVQLPPPSPQGEYHAASSTSTILPAPTALISDSIASSLAPTSTSLVMFPAIPPPSNPMPYSESWTDALMEHMLNAKSDSGKKGPQAVSVQGPSNQTGVPLTPTALPTSPSTIINPSPTESSPGFALAGPNQPLPPTHPFRTFRLPSTHPHASYLPLLTQPNGSIYGGPPPQSTADLHAYAADIVDTADLKHRSSMVRYLRREMHKSVDELERRMKARKAAKDSNNRVARQLRELEKERAAEIRRANQWKAENQKKNLKGRGTRGPRG